MESSVFISTSRKTKEFIQDGFKIRHTKKVNRFKSFLLPEDCEFLNSLEGSSDYKPIIEKTEISIDETTEKHFLKTEDLYAFYRKLGEDESVYLNKILSDSKIILPKCETLARNEDLEKRCEQLRIDLENLQYKRMVKNVDLTVNAVEESFSKQMKMANQQLTGVFNVMFSIIAGFLFSFFGLNLLYLDLSTETKIFFGLFISGIIGVAEFYFLFRDICSIEKDVDKIK